MTLPLRYREGFGGLLTFAQALERRRLILAADIPGGRFEGVKIRKSLKLYRALALAAPWGAEVLKAGRQPS